jgi:hypothetical protein
MMECERLVMRGDYAAALPRLHQLPGDFFAADTWVASALLVDCYYHLKDWMEMLRVTDKMKDYQFGAVTFLNQRRQPCGAGRLGCFKSCALHLIVVAVQHLPVCIHKVHLAVAGSKLVP